MKCQKGFNKQEIGAPLTKVVILNFEVCTLNLAQKYFHALKCLHMVRNVASSKASLAAFYQIFIQNMYIFCFSIYFGTTAEYINRCCSSVYLFNFNGINEYSYAYF